ncbi:MAG: SRPBCC family protein [Hyphomicrobiaceae bacterium]|nr:SRPBCC family protein [Hyphomicrobiaceae bacterium]
MQIIVEEIIRAPRALTFQIATDIRSWPSVVSAVKATELLTREPVGAGTRFNATRQFNGSSATSEISVLEFEPPFHFALGGLNHGARYRIDHVFSEDPQGTRLTLMFVARPMSMSARLLSPLALVFRAGLQRQLRADLHDFKTAVEDRVLGPAN